jgi:hypothetical protein
VLGIGSTVTTETSATTPTADGTWARSRTTFTPSTAANGGSAIGARSSAETVRGNGTAPNVSARAARAPSGVATAATMSPRSTDLPNAGSRPNPTASSTPRKPHSVGSGDGYDQASANDQSTRGRNGRANQTSRRTVRRRRMTRPGPRGVVRALVLM